MVYVVELIQEVVFELKIAFQTMSANWNGRDPCEQANLQKKTPQVEPTAGIPRFPLIRFPQFSIYCGL